MRGRKTSRVSGAGGRCLEWLSLLAGLVWLGAGEQSARAFSLIGPRDTFHTHTLGYLKYISDTPTPSSGWVVWTDGDFSTAPQNLWEGYRWNIPIQYYAYDETFLTYFGAEGVKAVDAGVAMFNDLAPVDSYSRDLTEFPTEELRHNYTAQALGLFDLRSAAIEVMLERLGLADSTQWAWCMRAKVLIPGAACPIYDYLVIQRNFDPATWLPSGYVNGNLYTYVIIQTCPPDVRGDFTDAEEVLVDSVGGLYATAIASPKILFPKPLWLGMFHTSFTRDDVGGLRYHYSTNNVQWEGTSPNVTVVVTNTDQGRVLTTSNLTLFAHQAAVTNAAGLTALYPGLVISSSTNWPVVVRQPVINAYFTNYPMDPVGSFPHLVITTNYILTVELRYNHTFENMVTFRRVNGVWQTVPITTLSNFMGHGFATLLTTVATNSPYDPAGTTPTTNNYARSFLTNEVVGDFALLPTNGCGFQVVASLLTNVVPSTNVVFGLIVGLTNNAGAFVLTNQFVEQSLVDYYTNRTFWVYDVDCLTTNAIALRQGVQKISFVRKDFDSLLGRYFYPVTNQYTLTEFTNNRFVDRTVLRRVTAPDIIFRASDLAGAFPALTTVARTTPTFNTSGKPPNVNGPGLLEGATIFDFNKVGPTFVNGTYPLFLDEAGAVAGFTWASFDGSANDPILYPVGITITNLLNRAALAIQPPVLPDATLGADYSAQFEGTGGLPPYSFSIAPGSPQPPLNLSLSAAGELSGQPLAAGTFNFTVRMTDSAARVTDHNYTLVVTP